MFCDLCEQWGSSFGVDRKYFDLYLVWCPGQNKRIAPLSFLHGCRKKATKGLTVLTPEIDCDQTAIGLPPVTSSVFLIADQFW
jgi:hypothetical protein